MCGPPGAWLASHDGRPQKVAPLGTPLLYAVAQMPSVSGAEAPTTCRPGSLLLNRRPLSWKSLQEKLRGSDIPATKPQPLFSFGLLRKGECVLSFGNCVSSLGPPGKNPMVMTSTSCTKRHPPIRRDNIPPGALPAGNPGQKWVRKDSPRR